jgi:predicted nucleic acid-binding protein
METWVVATRKIAKPVAEQKVAAFLDRVLTFPCVPGTADLYPQAFQLSRRYEIHPYDAATVAAAQELGAHTLTLKIFGLPGIRRSENQPFLALH